MRGRVGVTPDVDALVRPRNGVFVRTEVNLMNIATDQELRDEGISTEHANAFKAVAASQDCVILTRTPGKACLTLLAEGYDAKGFHIKGKSCDWGPMAGFICANPLFNKSGVTGAATNLKSHVDSFTKDFEARLHATKPGDPVYAGLVQIQISEERRLALVADGKIAASSETRVITGETLLPNSNPPKPPIMVKWLLSRETSPSRWLLYYDPTGLPAVAGPSAGTDAFNAAVTRASALAPAPSSKFAAYRPVLALTNPYPQYTDGEAYKNAITGDFDLFAVWPRRGRDHDFYARVAGMNPDVKKTDIYAAEEANSIGSVVGNISEGVYYVAQLLNGGMIAIKGQEKVNRVFHSDEGGRPGMTEIDGSVAFMPDGKIHRFANNSPDFPPFVFECVRANFVTFLNSGWIDLVKAGIRDHAAELSKFTSPWAALERYIPWQGGVQEVSAKAPTQPTPTPTQPTKPAK